MSSVVMNNVVQPVVPSNNDTSIALVDAESAAVSASSKRSAASRRKRATGGLNGLTLVLPPKTHMRGASTGTAGEDDPSETGAEPVMEAPHSPANRRSECHGVFELVSSPKTPLFLRRRSQMQGGGPSTPPPRLSVPGDDVTTRQRSSSVQCRPSGSQPGVGGGVGGEGEGGTTDGGAGRGNEAHEVGEEKSSRTGQQGQGGGGNRAGGPPPLPRRVSVLTDATFPCQRKVIACCPSPRIRETDEEQNASLHFQPTHSPY